MSRRRRKIAGHVYPSKFSRDPLRGADPDLALGLLAGLSAFFSSDEVVREEGSKIADELLSRYARRKARERMLS